MYVFHGLVHFNNASNGSASLRLEFLTDFVTRDVLLGLTGHDFTIIAASKAAMRGVTILKATDDKTRQLSDHTVMAYAGEAGDTGMPTMPRISPHLDP